MGLLQIILRQPHNCSDFSTFFDVWAINGRNLVCYCEPVNDVTLFKDSLRSQSVPLVLPWLPLWGSCHEVTERVKTPSPPLRGTSPIGRGKLPSSVSHLRGTREPPSPLGKASKTDCDRRESPEGATPVLRHCFVMACFFNAKKQAARIAA